MSISPSEPLQASQNKKRADVRLSHKNPSETLYEARRAALKAVCSNYGVLINDGWSFPSDEFYDDLAKSIKSTT